METNTIIQNGFGYQGVVKITYKDRGHKHSVTLRNEGTSYLGDLISIALSGDLRSLSSIEDRCASSLTFELYDGNEWRNLLSVSSPLTSSVWGEAVTDVSNNTDVIGKNKFSAIIPTSSIIRGYDSLVESRNLRLKLSNNRGEDLAYINDTIGSDARTLPLLYTALISGQDALIDWTMYILNYK